MHGGKRVGWGSDVKAIHAQFASSPVKGHTTKSDIIDISVIRL